MLLESLNRRRKAIKQPAGSGKPPTGAATRWHAVGIVTRPSACAAAQSCKGKRFLSSRAPRLPLPGCDAVDCGCKYRHYEDRRDGPRREHQTPAERLRHGSNRRTSGGRRATD